MDDDTDDDNWIEISNLAQLNAVRWDLDANGVVIAADTVKYAAAFPRAVANMGCATTCDGYELVADLDFDTNNDGRTDIAGDTYWNGGVGWNPIGQGSSSVRLPFQAEFSGNGHTISNLFIDRSTAQVGLFGVLGGSGFVHHVGLLNVDVTTTLNDVGALVGFMQGANTRVAASYVGSGSVTGAGQTGGLVGSAKGQVAASWTNVAVDGTTQVGGLVGNNDGGVQNAYALGTVSGSGGFVHGVVGATESGADLVAVYYNSDIHQVTSAPYSKTTFDLQNATGYGGIYGLWNVNIDGHVGNDQPWDSAGATSTLRSRPTATTTARPPGRNSACRGALPPGRHRHRGPALGHRGPRRAVHHHRQFRALLQPAGEPAAGRQGQLRHRRVRQRKVRRHRRDHLGRPNVGCRHRPDHERRSGRVRRFRHANGDHRPRDTTLAAPPPPRSRTTTPRPLSSS